MTENDEQTRMMAENCYEKFLKVVVHNSQHFDAFLQHLMDFYSYSEQRIKTISFGCDHEALTIVNTKVRHTFHVSLN